MKVKICILLKIQDNILKNKNSERINKLKLLLN